MKEIQLSHAQKRVWFSEMKLENTCLNNIGGYFKIEMELNFKVLKDAVNEMIGKFDTLRLVFHYGDNGELLSMVKDYEPKDIPVKEFATEDDLVEWTEELFQKRFVIENNEELYRIFIYKVKNKYSGVLMCTHHIIMDGWSINLILNYAIAMYKLHTNEQLTSQMSKETHSYQEFISYEEKISGLKRMDKAKDFWNAKFKNISDVFLYNSFETTKGKRIGHNVSEALCEKIRYFLKDSRVSMNSLAMMAMILYSYFDTYEEDVVIGTVTHNRVTRVLKDTAGMMTNTIPIHFKVEEQETIRDFIERFQNLLKEDFYYQIYPYDEIVKNSNIVAKGYDSLFKISVNCYSIKCPETIQGKDIEIQELYSGEQSYSAQFIFSELVNGNFRMTFDYKNDEYDELEVKFMFDGLEYIMDMLVTDKDKRICDLYLANYEKIALYMSKFNSHSVPVCKETYSTLFSQIAKEHPNEIAIEEYGEKLTYAEFEQKIGKMSNFLIENDVCKGDIIGIMQKPSISLITSIFAVLRCGASYIPIDIDYPEERIRYILEDAKCKLLLSDNKNIKVSSQIIDTNQIQWNLYDDNFTDSSELDDLAYLIYTSGSTGRPKGVMVGNDNLMNYIQWAKKMYSNGCKVSMPLYTSISFDLTITSIFLPFLTGGTLVIYDESKDQFILEKIIEENKVNVIKLTPAHLRLMEDLTLENSKVHSLIVGGDDLKSELAGKIYNKFKKDVNIYNEYGPTETTVGCMIYRYSEKDLIRGSVPIGYPADNAEIYVLDKRLQMLPVGKTGEIYIAGEGVTRGYLGIPDLTRKNFVENPYKKGTIMYKTGDAARFISEDTISYLGRIDKQIKVRGFRIELGEIEKCALKNESVKDAVAVYYDQKEVKGMAVYVVLKQTIEEAQLIQFCKNYLPYYMVPQFVIPVDVIPLTINGKIDYKQLPLPKQKYVQEAVECDDMIVNEILEQVKLLLNLQEVSLRDNFIQLGGDSIIAIQLSFRLKKMNYKVNIKDILDSSNLMEIINKIEKTENIQKIQCGGYIKNTPILNWFFLQQFEQENYYCQFVQISLNTVFDYEKIQDAFHKLIQAHDTLRLSYNPQQGTFTYKDEYLKETNINVYEKDLNTDLLEYMCNLKKERAGKICLSEGCLIDLSIVQCAENHQELLFVAHHAIVDVVSWKILIENFFDCLDGRKIYGIGNSYQHWSDRLYDYAQNDFSAEMDYWDKVQENSLHIDKSMRTGETSKVTLSFDYEFVDSLEQKMKEYYNLNLDETLLIAVAITVMRQFEKQAFVIDLESYGRDLMEDLDVSTTIGWFTNIYGVYFEGKFSNISEQLVEFKEQLRQVPSKGKNFGVIHYLKSNRKEKPSNNVRFNYFGNVDKDIRVMQDNIRGVEFGLLSNNASNAWVEINAFESGDALMVEYESAYLDNQTLREFTEEYQKVLHEILETSKNINDIQLSVSDFNLLDIEQDEFNNLFD